MNKSNPPMGFVSRDWSKEMKVGEPKSDEETRPPGIVPIPVSGDDGRTLDWSQSRKCDSASSPLLSNPTIWCKLPAVIRHFVSQH